MDTSSTGKHNQLSLHKRSPFDLGRLTDDRHMPPVEIEVEGLRAQAQAVAEKDLPVETGASYDLH